jgi:ParB family chromosome partitioning protein
MSALKKKGLGRGLEALLGAAMPELEASAARDSSLMEIDISSLQAGRYQPRQVMDEEALDELADSIRSQGVIQPIVVRPIGANPSSEARYEIIAGERRFRAAQRAGLLRIPAVIREVDDQVALAMALIENLQRRDLSAIEEAHGISRLISEFGLTHEQAAKAVGKSRSATSNLLRLLALPDTVQAYLRDGQLEAGHARVLVTLAAPQQRALAELIVAQKLSVREVEDRARQLLGGGKRTKPRGASTEGAADWRRMEEQLADQLGLVVALKPKASGGGEIRIHFSGPDEFEGLLHRLLPGSHTGF